MTPDNSILSLPTHGADMAEVQRILCHVNIATTPYYQRNSRLEQSSVFKMRF